MTDRATEPNTEPLARVSAVGTDQERDVSEIQNSEISTIGSTTKNPSAAEFARAIERTLDEVMQPDDDCTGHAAAPINGAVRSPDNLTDDASELTASVEQSRSTQIVTTEPTGLSNRDEGQVLNTFYQDLE